jgi:amino acid transporter
MLGKIKKFLIGSPLPDWEYKHQRLPKTLALAVFSSDSMSSVAYATEEIVLALLLVGSFALAYTLPISMAILALLWILIFSYRQTIAAYPKGGGSYIVAKENLGTNPGLVAASALLLDYILTVSVSVAAGVAALVSAFPQFYPERVIIGVVVIGLISIINLKGVKESGLIFSVPTYLFITSAVLMIAVGMYQYFTGTLHPVYVESQATILGSLTLFVILRAFSSGCTALTGIEAMADGVPAFKEPEAVNARKTLLWMAIILTTLFFGISFLSHELGLIPSHDRTLVSLVAESIFGRTPAFFILQATTMLILFLAANTSFADFPRLCFFLSKDNFLPHQFKQLGDRLVFTNGILFLGVSAAALIVIFGGVVHALIPLYAVGVFTSFTLSQSGMVVRHWKLREKGWKRSIFINGFGAVVTFVVTIIIAVSKFMQGAWVIIILIMLGVYIFKNIHAHYDALACQLSLSGMKKLKFEKEKHIMLVMVPSFHKGVVQALGFAKTFSENVVAVHVKLNKKDTANVEKYWKKFNIDVPLHMIESPYRKMIQPIMSYVDRLEKDQKMNVVLVIPEFVPKKWWHHLLHNQTALSLKTAIHFRPRTNYISMQYHLER